MLITSRDTGRWIIPKGWPQKGCKPHKVAAREAYEEAGLVGHPAKRCIGSYQYKKRLSPKVFITCNVRGFLLEVEQQLDDWPEKAERQRCWCTPFEAAARVEEFGLRMLLRNFSLPLQTPPGS